MHTSVVCAIVSFLSQPGVWQNGEPRPWEANLARLRGTLQLSPRRGAETAHVILASRGCGEQPTARRRHRSRRLLHYPPRPPLSSPLVNRPIPLNPSSLQARSNNPPCLSSRPYIGSSGLIVAYARQRGGVKLMLCGWPSLRPPR